MFATFALYLFGLKCRSTPRNFDGKIDGVLDPDADILETLAIEPGSIKRLAQNYLEKIGIAAE